MLRWFGFSQRLLLAGGLLATTLGACSTVMEAQRPDPVDLHKYTLGQRRIEVLSRLGSPTSSVQDGADSCDVYKLYTNGVSRVGKGAIIATEAAADFFTLGLAEVVATPGEAATKNKLHTVLVCYTPDQTLLSITDEGKPIMAMPGADTPGSSAPPAAGSTSAPSVPSARP